MNERGYELNSELYTLPPKELIRIARKAILKNLDAVFNLQFLFELENGNPTSNESYLATLLAITESIETRDLKNRLLPPLNILKAIDTVKFLNRWEHLEELISGYRSSIEVRAKSAKDWCDEMIKLEEEIRKRGLDE